MAQMSYYLLLDEVCVRVCVHANVCVCVNMEDKPIRQDLWQYKHDYIFTGLHCLSPLCRIKLHPIFPHSLVARTNEHLSILREVYVINDSITHHPVRSHSTHPRSRPI